MINTEISNLITEIIIASFYKESITTDKERTLYA